MHSMRSMRWAAGAGAMGAACAVAAALGSADGFAECSKSCPASKRDANGCCPVSAPTAVPSPKPSMPPPRPTAVVPVNGTAKCAATEHASGGHCCKAGAEWVPAKSACVCLDAAVCGAAPAASAVPAASGTAAVAKPTCPADMVLIQGGTFKMGSLDSDKGADSDERPQHDVTVATFCLAKTETTAAAYEKCVNSGSCTASGARISSDCTAGKSDKATHPINCVDWTQATAYCKAQGGRLPSEEEWEYAARGKAGRTYPWGSAAPDETRVNACGAECKRAHPGSSTMYTGDDGWAATAPTGSFAKGATPEGVLDLAGNVWEWTASAHCSYSGMNCVEPRRVVRGGSWNLVDESVMRGANRSQVAPTDRYDYLGVRCATTP